MAEQESGGWIGAVTTAVASTAAVMTGIWNAIMKDGTLAAAGRQGADELAMALRAFPESIHADEPGTILNPTQGEIAASRNPHLPSPSEIAKDKHPYTVEHSQDHGQGRDR